MAGNYDKVYDFASLALSLLKIVVQGFPYLILLGVLGTGIAFVISKLGYFNQEENNNDKPTRRNYWNYAFVTLLVISFVNFSLISYFFVDRIPHVPDEIGYASQAKIFAKGQLYLDEPVLPDFFPIPGMIRYQGRWFSQYPFGHSLILSLGYLIDAPWIIPALVSVISLIFIFLIGKELYSERVGFWSAFLAFSSPFYQMNSINFMSHISTLLFTLIFIWAFIKMVTHKRIRYALLMGLSLGYVFNIRPYDAFLIALPVNFYLIFLLVKNIRHARGLLIAYRPYVISTAVMILLYFGYNFALTHKIMLDIFELSGSASRIFGFSGTRTLNQAMQDTYANLSLLDKILLGWPYGLTFVPLFVCLLTARIKKWEGFFIGMIAVLIGGYTLFKGSWMMYGPRFWFGTTPFLFLLAVLGIEKIPLLVSKRIIITKRAHTFLLILSYTLVVSLSVNSLENWYVSPGLSEWHDDYTPKNISDLKGFNYANRNLINEIEKEKIGNALIFIEPSPDWWAYGIPSYSMDISLKGNIVYAMDLGKEKNKVLMMEYPGRNYYTANYDTREVKTY